MEGGNQYREGAVEYDGAADAAGKARYFYYSLNEGIVNCTKDRPDTASATPVSYGGYWIVGDCENNLLGFKSPDSTPTLPGGLLTPAWKLVESLGKTTPEPRFATPVIDAAGTNGMPAGTMYVLWKSETNPLLGAFQLNGADAPTRLWTFALSTILNINVEDGTAIFRTFGEDHAIFWHEGRVYVPSRDFDGMAIFTPSLTGATYIITPGQWRDTHRLYGSVAGAGEGGSDAVFLVHGSLYGIQSYDAAGLQTVGGVFFNASLDNDDFSHPVQVTFSTGGGTSITCIIATEWDVVGDIFITGVDAATLYPCGYGTAIGPWSTRGYYIRAPAFAMPSWVSAPAVLYDGFRTVFLVYAVNLPDGDRDGNRRSGWRCAIVAVQVDQTGPYTTPPEDVSIIYGAHCNSAPLIVREAYGAGNHAIVVGASDGKLYVFPSVGFKATGPILAHDLIGPTPVAVDGGDNSRLGVAGNYLAASSGGSIASILYNGRAQEYWFAIVTGVM